MNSASILIVDDQNINRAVLAAILGTGGAPYQFHFAADGLEALKIAREVIPDLVLLDAMMPGLDGFGACLQLRADPLLAEIPIVMVTALEDSQSKVKGLSAGADDFISKPFNGEELRARVATITRLNRFRLLLQQRTRFEWVVENAEEGYLVLDQQGHASYANSRARRMLEVGPGPFSFVDHVPARFRCVPPQAWREWQGDPTQKSCPPLYLVRPERGQSPALWLQLTTSVEASANECIVRLRDLSDTVTHQMSAWIFQSQVSQKLRGPLQKLGGGLGLQQRLPDGPDRLRAAAAQADECAAEVGQAIEAILSNLYASPTPAGGCGPQVDALPALIARIGEELECPSLTVKSEEIVEPQATLALAVESLERAVRAILENSLRFHPAGSPRVVVRLLPVSQRLRLVIEDDGLSLTPLQLQRALLPYYQGEKSHTGQMAGMGLGLSTVASMMWEIGGDCRILNRDPGPGVVVELDIPLRGADS